MRRSDFGWMSVRSGGLPFCMPAKYFVVQKSFITLALQGPSPSQAAKLSNFAGQQDQCPILVGRPIDKQGLPVGLYNPIFDEFRTRFSNPTAQTDVTPDHLSSTSKFCTAAVAIYKNERSRREAMQDMLAHILYQPMSSIFARNGAISDGTILTIAHGMSLYRAVLEWKNDIGEGGCDAVKQGCFSFRNYWIQKDVRNPILCSSDSHSHML